MAVLHHPAETPLFGARGRALAATTGVLAIALAIMTVAIFRPVDQDPDDLYADPWSYVKDLSFLGYLVGSIAAVEVARRRDVVRAAPARLVQTGYALITVGVVAGLMLGYDPGWFFILAGPGLLASAVGFLWWAVQAYRRHVLPTWAAVLLGVGGTTAIALGEFGTSILIGSFWLYLAGRAASPAADG